MNELQDSPGRTKDFKPYVPAETSLSELTVRALVWGVVMACVLGAANAYLGMKVGLTVAATFPAAVVAMADEKWGEVPCAFVHPVDDGEELTPEEIIAFCREHMAHFKAPRKVVLGELPKTATGKIRKNILRDSL